MIGVARHQTGAGVQLDPDTQPINYSLSWPSLTGTTLNTGTGATPPLLDTLLSWSAETVNYWIYLPTGLASLETQSFRIGGINFGYNGIVDQLYINECVFTSIADNQWISVLYQNSQSGQNTVVRVNDQLPNNRTFPGYPQDDPLDSPTAYQPATANQSIGVFSSAARNHWETPATPGIYTNSWVNPILGLVRYSTQALDLSTRARGTARWTAYNDDSLPGRDLNNLWSTPYTGFPTKTLGTETITTLSGSQTYTTHTYNWPSGFTIASRIVDTNLTVSLPSGMKIAIRWTPTNDAEYSYVFPPTA